MLSSTAIEEILKDERAISASTKNSLIKLHAMVRAEENSRNLQVTTAA
jgi:hypothetical protein